LLSSLCKYAKYFNILVDTQDAEIHWDTSCIWRVNWLSLENVRYVFMMWHKTHFSYSRGHQI